MLTIVKIGKIMPEKNPPNSYHLVESLDKELISNGLLLNCKKKSISIIITNIDPITINIFKNHSAKSLFPFPFLLSLIALYVNYLLLNYKNTLNYKCFKIQVTKNVFHEGKDRKINNLFTITARSYTFVRIIYRKKQTKKGNNNGISIFIR